jgi:hypothetical protein
MDRRTWGRFPTYVSGTESKCINACSSRAHSIITCVIEYTIMDKMLMNFLLQFVQRIARNRAISIWLFGMWSSWYETYIVQPPDARPAPDLTSSLHINLRALTQSKPTTLIVTFHRIASFHLRELC